MTAEQEALMAVIEAKAEEMGEAIVAATVAGVEPFDIMARLQPMLLKFQAAVAG